jgi:hypothetical protein
VSLRGGEDFGADLAHPDLVNNLWANTGEVASNGVDDDGDGFICDTSALGSGDSYVVFLGGAVAASTPPGTAVPRIRLSGVRGNRSRLFFVATGESLLVDHRGQSLRLRHLFGCVGFMISAVFAVVLPTPPVFDAVTISVFFTLLGATGFLVGSLLMLPETAATGEA